MKDILRDISISKLTEETLVGDAKKVNDFFINLLDGIEEYISDKYPGDIFFRKNGIIYMKHDSKNKRLWCSHEHIWSFFETEFGYKYEEISQLIQSMLEIHLNQKVSTPVLDKFVFGEGWKYI